MTAKQHGTNEFHRRIMRRPTSAAVVSVIAHVFLGVLVWNALKMPGVFDQLVQRDRQAQPVALQNRIACQPHSHCGEYPGRMLVVRQHYSVVHPLALTSRGHHSGTTQVSQMARDLWLIGFQNFHQKADTDLVFAHQTEQAQTSAIGERPEEDFDVLVF